MMYDNQFLEQLMLQQHKTIYARITALNIDDSPIEFVEGTLTSGSVNVDGTSAVRRTCSLSMVTEKVNVSDYLWGLDTRFKLEVGVENVINKLYPKIIWFNQGIYIISSFSTSMSVNNYTINLQGKDKMCLLNGENGGVLGFEVDFGTFEEELADKTIKKASYPLKDIIREAVHHYGGEPFHNIIINGLDDKGLELQEYRYDTPLYLIRNQQADQISYIQGTLHGDQTVYVNGQKTQIQDLEKYDTMIGSDFSESRNESTAFTFGGGDNTKYCSAKITYGRTVGYTPTDMTYNGELIAKAGETITSVLDKIKNMLGNFEYFYDVDGRFIFQEQQNYVNTSWSPLETTTDGLIYVNPESTRIQFSFRDGALISSFNNTPNLANLKNDYSVWGTRKSAGGQQLPIHMRYAIDQKPVEYTTIAVSDEELVNYNNKHDFNLKGQSSVTYVADNISTPVSVNGKIHCDWRELIYQMALDYRKYNHLDNFERKIAIANPLFPSGKTGYEQYYIDMEGFWRQLYNYGEGLYVRAYTINEDAWNNKEYYVKGEGGVFIKQGEPGFPKELSSHASAVKSTTTLYKLSTDFGPNGGWTYKVTERPEELNFWFDMLDSQGELSAYSVANIGSRPKVSNDNDVKAIYYKQTPEIIFVSKDEKDNATSGYTHFNIGEGYKNMFSQSTQGKTAKDAIDLLLYNHAYCVESVSISSVPIYYLEPNRRIYVEDSASGIQGEYIASRYSIPLTYNGTMSITATKAVDRII